MATVLLVLVVVLVIAALAFGVVSLLSGDDPGLDVVEPDGRAIPLPNTRSLTEADLKAVRFDVELRGYRMAQVDRALRRTAYDIGYKDEMIAVLEAEVAALREGRSEDAELLRTARESAANPAASSPATGSGRSAGAPGDLRGLATPRMGDAAAGLVGTESRPAGPSSPGLARPDEAAGSQVVATTHGAVTSDSGTRDSATSDSGTSNSATSDSVTSDSVTRDSVTRDSVTRDSVTRDSVTRDSATSDGATRPADSVIDEVERTYDTEGTDSADEPTRRSSRA